jgi:sulfate transport system ATP-binding protein
VQDGKAHLGPLAVDYPAHVSSEARSAVGYARPHELELDSSSSEGGLPATVRDVRVSGALVKVELVDESDRVIQVELGREQYEQLRTAPGQRVYVKPKRLRVFTSD